jgi:hypothetical protein
MFGFCVCMDYTANDGLSQRDDVAQIYTWNFYYNLSTHFDLG